MSSSLRARSMWIWVSPSRTRPIRSSRKKCPSPRSPTMNGRPSLTLTFHDTVVLVAQNPARSTISEAMVYALLAPCWEYSKSRSQPELMAREPFLTDHQARTVSSYKGLSMVSTVEPSEDTKNSEPSMSNPAWMVAEMVSLTPGIEWPPQLTWMPLAGELIHAEVWMGDVWPSRNTT